MIRKLFILILIFISVNGFPRQPEKGYRGFIEWSNDIRRMNYLYPGNRVTEYGTGVSTSHGYQLNRIFFIGAGMALESFNHSESYLLPVFLQGRVDLKFNKLTPFGDIRLGYNLTQGGGVYFSPTIGYRFNWGRKIGINIGAGLTLQDRAYYNFVAGTTPEGYQTLIPTNKYHYCMKFFAFRIGFDF